MPKPWINLVVACGVVLVASLVLTHADWPLWIEFLMVALVGAGAYMISARVCIYLSAQKHNPPFVRTPRTPKHR